MSRLWLSLVWFGCGSSLAAAEPVEWLDESRVKVTTTIQDPDNLREHFDAQILLTKLAKKACGRKKRAVSEGTLNLDSNGEEGSKKRLILSEVYVCAAK